MGAMSKFINTHLKLQGENKTTNTLMTDVGKEILLSQALFTLLP